MRILIFFLLLVFVAASAFGVANSRRSPPRASVEADIADVRFSFPAAYARDAATAGGGPVDRLAFAATFPDFAPLEPASAARAPRARIDGDEKIVFVTVSPPDEAIEPADRPSRLYARFLGANVWSGPRGLVMRRFERGTPYELEELYVAPPDGRAFFARCLTSRPVEKTLPQTCLSIFRTQSLDVELRFSPLLLQRWDALISGARDFIERIGGGAGPDDKH